MGDLLTSMFRFSWTMSLLGARQAADLLSGRQEWHRTAAASFDVVRYAAEDGMGPVTRSLFQAGDRFQRGAVDLTFDLARQALDPRLAWQALPRLASAFVRPGK
ncbi:MAG TPA: hypothetical protein VGG03_06520 [Thermoanaerobaculia bacterium]|jgi:hypothetical protein